MFVALSRVPLKVWIGGGILLAIALLWTGYHYQKGRADRAVADLAPARASVEALDRVATETPVIRQDQQEKQREVENIPGADQRLPDGFGANLERVRRGQHQDTRKPEGAVR